jgi:hypothetical protein
MEGFGAFVFFTLFVWALCYGIFCASQRWSLLADCEANLPRDQECVLVAVPEAPEKDSPKAKTF